MPIETVNLVVTGPNPRTIPVNINVGLTTGTGTASALYQGGAAGEDTISPNGTLSNGLVIGPGNSNVVYVAWQLSTGNLPGHISQTPGGDWYINGSNPGGTNVHGSGSPAIVFVYDFNLNIPPSATILGVEALINSTNNYNVMEAALGTTFNNGTGITLLGSWKTFTGGPSNQNYLLGSPTDLWGNTTSTLTPAVMNVNGPTLTPPGEFSLMVKFVSGTGYGDTYLTFKWIKVWYSVPTVALGSNLQLSVSNGNFQPTGSVVQLTVGLSGIVYTTKTYIPILEGTVGKLYAYSDPSSNVYNFQAGLSPLEFNSQPIGATAALGSVFQVTGSNSSWQGRVAIAYDPAPTGGRTINGATGAYELQYNGSVFDPHVDITTLTLQADDIAWYNSVNNAFDVFVPTLTNGGTFNQIELDYMVNPTLDAAAPYVAVSPTSFTADGNPHVVTITLPKPMSPQQQGVHSTGNVVNTPTVTFSNGTVSTPTPVLDGSGWLTGWTVTVTPVVSSSNISASLGFTLTGTLTYFSGDSFITGGAVTYVPTQAIPITLVGSGYVAPTISAFLVVPATGEAPSYYVAPSTSETLRATVTNPQNDATTCAFYAQQHGTSNRIMLGMGSLINSYASGGLYYKEFQLVSSDTSWYSVNDLGAQATDTVSVLQSNLYFDSSTYTVGTPPSGGGGCFTGNVAIRVTLFGVVELMSLSERFELVNETGTHWAELIVHENYKGWMLELAPNKLVTVNHIMKLGNDWVPAEEKYLSLKRVWFEGTVYNVHVISDDPADQHYILWNGDVAHNNKIGP